MDYGEFRDAIDRMRSQAVKEHRRKIIVGAVLLLATTALILGFIGRMTVFPGDSISVVAAALAALGVAAIQLRRPPPTFPALDRALLTADVENAVKGADGSIACLCAEGVILTAERRVVAFDRDSERIESISWDEDAHALKLQVWQRHERQNRERTEYETIATYRVMLPATVSADEALAIALSWEKYRGHVRETGAPPPLS